MTKIDDSPTPFEKGQVWRTDNNCIVYIEDIRSDESVFPIKARIFYPHSMRTIWYTPDGKYLPDGAPDRWNLKTLSTVNVTPIRNHTTGLSFLVGKRLYAGRAVIHSRELQRLYLNLKYTFEPDRR